MSDTFISEADGSLHEKENLLNRYSYLLYGFATTFCSNVGSVLEMLSKYICTCGSAIHIFSFSNRYPYLCELPIFSRDLRISKYRLGIVDSSNPCFLAIASTTLCIPEPCCAASFIRYAMCLGIPNF